MKTVVLGGGISGLSAVHYFLKRFNGHPVTLLEKTDRLGGWIKSRFVDQNILFEQGPRTIRPKGEAGANTLSLVQELNLTDQIVPVLFSSPAARNRMIYANGNLNSLPSGLSDLFVKRTPFSKPLIYMLLKDVFARKHNSKDESLYSFVHRRFGREFADYLISPMVCGICAGNAKEISVNFLMKTFFEYEQKYGSITKGIVSSIFKKSDQSYREDNHPLISKSKMWSVYSFKDGMETLPKTLEYSIKQHESVDIKLNASCKKLSFKENIVNIELDNGEEVQCNHMISAIPSTHLGDIISSSHPDLANLLKNIKSVDVCVVNLYYDKKLITKDGFGFLVPPIENIPLLGVIYDSCILEHRDVTVLTAMMGGYWFNKYFSDDTSEKEVLEIAKEQLKHTMGIEEPPVDYKVNILKKCIPQYVVGHQENLENIYKYIKQHKLPLSVCGASYNGVGVNDVILSAKNAVYNFSNKTPV